MKSLIVDPMGSPTERVEAIDPRKMLILAQLAEFVDQTDMGLHCSRCKADFIGRNSSSDGRWTIACQCRAITADMGRGKPAA